MSTLTENALFLFGLADPTGKSVTFYDEDDNTVHSLENGVLTISANFVDYTTYKLTRTEAAGIQVQLERLDNYRLHEKAKKVAWEMDQEDEEDLADRLDRLAEQIRIAQNKQALSSAEQASLAAMMISAGEWEWKEWPEIGTNAIQAALEENGLGITLADPTPQQTRKVYGSDDFSKGVLQWFRAQLNPHGWTLVAVSPMDEYQAFALVRNEDLATVKALQQKQGERIQ